MECGPNDDPCNGPLEPGAEYRVKYTLISGTEMVEYDFFNATYNTAEEGTG
jgi:hypothetical protein